MYWNLIHKYLSDQCTEAEHQAVESWLAEDANHRAFFKSVKQIWEVKPRKKDSVDVEAAWNRFRKRNTKQKEALSQSDLVNEKYRVEKRTKWYSNKMFYAAAAIIFLLAVVFVAKKQVSVTSQITYQEIITNKGEKTSLKLSDGSTLMLNAQSSVKIPSNYGKDDRTLYLSGEAFFEVTHDPSRPFRVYTKDIYTEDLGTKFSIRALPGDGRIEVVVSEGEVKVGETKKQYSLDSDALHVFPNERALISENNSIYKERVDNLSLYLGWTQGKLVFKETPFGEVVDQLERWYDIECIVKDKMLLNEKLTATFEEESLSNVLKLIARSMDIKVISKDQEIIFRNKDNLKVN